MISEWFVIAEPESSMLLLQHIYECDFINVVLFLQLGVPFFDYKCAVIYAHCTKCLREVGHWHCLDAEDIICIEY